LIDMDNRQLTDNYQRRLNYLRVSVTDRCNLRCIYCVPRDSIPRLLHTEILTYEEILRVIRVGARMGITKIRVTGGEPLVRKGITGFLSRVTQVPGIRDTSLTTNGVLLEDFAEDIRSAGISRINVSLDSMERSRFRQITGKDRLRQVWKGLEKALSLGFDPIKLNVVALSGLNDDELEAFARLTFEYPFHVRFIEYMPMGKTPLPGKRLLLGDDIRARVQKVGELTALQPFAGDGPAEYYRFPGSRGKVGIIRPMTHHFCSSCNRLRLTASGQIRPCLLTDIQIDIRDVLRGSGGDAQIEKTLLKAVSAKPDGHHLNDENPRAVRDQMTAIGG
jgi:cyclic pyranopterin phosphate synthase